MSELFLHLLNMSITAGWLVLAVLLARLILKKAPRWISVALWALVAVRLILPVSPESGLSLIPSAETVPTDIIYLESPAIQSGIPAFNSAVNPILSEILAPAAEDSVNPLQVVTFVCAAVWVLGMVLMVGYTAISVFRLRRTLREAARLRDNIWECDRVDTPFIFGFFRPRIYLPSGISPRDAELVIAHEKAHLRRRDHWWKPLGFLLLTVYWFNPLLWIAYRLLCRDIETACDEKVISEAEGDVKKAYSEALIHCSFPRKAIAACPLAFGEVGVKQRVRSVLNYKKPAFWIILAAAVLCVGLALCFLTNPVRVEEPLTVFIDGQLTDYSSSGREGYVGFLDWDAIHVDRSGDRTTVYLWALWEEYSYDGELHCGSGSHMFHVITVEKQKGAYVLQELWTPRDGTLWASDIRDKVPWYLYLRAIDSQASVEKQSARVKRMAEAYFGLVSADSDGESVSP